MVCDRNVDLSACTPRSTVNRRLLLRRKRKIATVLEWPVGGRSYKKPSDCAVSLEKIVSSWERLEGPV
jgi:hypothetical protein